MKTVEKYRILNKNEKKRIRKNVTETKKTRDRRKKGKSEDRKGKLQCTLF